jgi:hypothetical protein
MSFFPICACEPELVVFLRRVCVCVRACVCVCQVQIFYSITVFLIFALAALQPAKD